MRAYVLAALVVVALTSMVVTSANAVTRNLDNRRALLDLGTAEQTVFCWAWRPGDVSPLASGRTGTWMQRLASLWRGCAAHAAGDVDRASTEWRLAGADTYFLTHARAAVARGDHGLALQLYQLISEVDPESPAAWRGTAAAQMNLATVGQAAWADMTRSASRALALAPDDPEAHYLHGYALWLSGADLQEAERELRWAVQRRGDWGELYSLARLLLDDGRPAESSGLLQRALKQVDHQEVNAQLVRAYLATGACDDARRLFGELVARDDGGRDRLQQLCAAASACSCE